jgi:type IV pilus assembly protein PilA
MLHAIRRRVQEEQGFTLIELLVVILIIGILAAIAIPSFLSQKDKANDAAAKSYVRNMQTAEETYFTDNNAYAPNVAALVTIESALAQYPDGVAADVTATPNANGYVISAKSKGSSGVVYTLTKDSTATPPVSHTCAPASKGGCNAGSTW